jgi:hypothetical protein
LSNAEWHAAIVAGLWRSRREARYGEKNILAASASAEPWVSSNDGRIQEDTRIDLYDAPDTSCCIELSCFEQTRSSWGAILILQDEDEHDESCDEMHASNSV